MFELTPEKKNQYRKNRYKKQQKTREIRQKRLEGKETSLANLQFVEDILKAKGITWADIERSGIISQQMAHYIRMQDDISLRKLQQIMSAVGINIKPEFEGVEPEGSVVAAVKNYSIVDEDNGDIIVDERNTDTVLARYAKKAVEEGKRLSFLALVILNWKESWLKFTRKTGIYIKSLQNYFIKDDIKVSRINQIGKALGKKVLWKISKN